MYTLPRKLLFLLDPETSHTFALKSLKILYRLRLLNFIFPKPSLSSPQILMGLSFPHTVGLAAGLDKNAEYIDTLAALGFGFIEVGTITPRPQAGNSKPRLFRLINDEAIINRMGFNNKGVEYAVNQLKNVKYKGILGINIGKNRDTPNEKAAEDYLYCFKQLWPYASYMTINISSPNTAGLRDLQEPAALASLLHTLKNEQMLVHSQHGKYIPLVVKIAPDLTNEAVDDLAEILMNEKIDGVIATNTTLSRDGLTDQIQANETGGLSGKPLQAKSTAVIRQLRKHLANDFPIIAAGGIMDAASAEEKINAGANLLQVYTGFIYKGPGIIKELAQLRGGSG